MSIVLDKLRKKCAEAKYGNMKEAIANLKDIEQLAVWACIQASKVKNTRGMRYNRQWVYECVLLRIKSKKAYKHLRKHKILALPSLQTLERCLKRIKSAYGFQENVFLALKFKTTRMNVTETHGM